MKARGPLPPKHDQRGPDTYSPTGQATGISQAEVAQDGAPVTVQRTFATARSVEFDAILLAGAPAPGADATGARDAKVDDGAAVTAGVDPPGAAADHRGIPARQGHRGLGRRSRRTGDSRHRP